jgi:UDP-N-acetylmuramyl pentapeptide phosphotransferase/UDP-N-acetylglucosamine-1-phosphate transferase
MLNLGVAFTTSFCALLIIVRYAKQLAPASLDFDLSGVQKNHGAAVPRIGGLGIAIAMVFTFAVSALFERDGWRDSLLLMACAAPAFLSGIIEDMTKRVSTRVRLLSAMASALACALVLQAAVSRIDVPMIDHALMVTPIAIAFTMLAVAGVTNAVNIIDGFNGLASMVAFMMFASLAYVAFQVHDPVVLSASFMMMGAVLGFFIWNFPAGLIFLGDGGAYFIGFMLAELSILLVMRNRDVSAWYPVLLFMYPIFETCFSIYRKKFIRGISPGIPDGVHLHMLVYKRLMRWAVGARTARELTRRNSLTSPYLWLLCLIAVIPATLFWRHTLHLFCFVVVFAATYVWLYVSIVRFKSPRWMVVRKGKH